MQLDNPFFLMGAGILTIILAAVIFRAFFNVSANTWYQKKQLELLQKIAEKHGVTEEELNEIMTRPWSGNSKCKRFAVKSLILPDRQP
jgi:hypothetical protein